MKGRWLLLFAVFVLAVLGAGYFLVPISESKINQAACAKVQLSMNAQQVRQILGIESYGTLPAQDSSRFWLVWSDEDQNEIWVGFNHDSDKALDKGFYPSSLTSLEKLKGRIQRRLPSWLR